MHIRTLCSSKVYLIFSVRCDRIISMKVIIKKSIKSVLALIISASVLISLAACSRGGEKTPSETAETTSNVVRVTFPEGSSVSQIAALLEENGVCSAADFMAAANDPQSLEGFSFEIENPENRAFLLEGYLFPDTYDFYRNENPSSVIKRFLKNSESKLDSDILARCSEIGYSLDEILTLASIIQEEAGNPAEMATVSSVLHNRLDSDSFPKLQCDAATFYLRDYVKPYVDEERYEQLKELYNTYNCEGLPAGPITNSGIEAVRAALYPEETDYYFFITDGEGVYHYAETFAEHRENCENAGL